MKLISLYWRLHARPVADLIQWSGRIPTGLTSAQERRAVYTATWFFAGFCDKPTGEYRLVIGHLINRIPGFLLYQS